MPDVHLSRTELTQWRDDGAGDRDRIVAHLAVCAACREAAAAVERERRPEADAAPPTFAPREFVERGYAAGPSPSAARRAPRWLWVAAAAALVVLALVPDWLGRVEDRPDTVRGGAPAIELRHPIDGTVAVDELRFEWAGVSADARVRLNVVSLDRPGEPIIERELIGTHYVPTAEERQRFRAGQSVHWYVEGRDGSAGAASPAARFRIR